MKEEISRFISSNINLPEEDVFKLIEIPPNQSLGDYSFPCFTLSKELKKSPVEIALDLKNQFSKKLPKEIDKVETKGPYLNFFVNKIEFTKGVFKLTNKKDFGNNKEGKGKTIVIDMSSPNIAKPFGVGHLRSTIIGNSISNIYGVSGYKTVKLNYLGDYGTQFGKVILGYKKFGDPKKLKEKPIEHLYELYIKGNEEQYEEEARIEFKKLEEGDKENKKLWELFKDLSLKEFDEIYELLGIGFDVISGESKYNGKMQEVIKLLEDKKLLKKDQGANIVDLKEFDLGVAIIQKSDGTSLYHTRDLTAAIDRFKKYKADGLIYEVGQEQTLHFRQLFKMLELLGFDFAKNCIHTGHGLYLDTDGKKFATRKGKTIFLKDVIIETIEKAKENLVKRNPEKLSPKELERRARIIALAAIFYGDLKVYLKNDVIFDLDKFLSFEGDTGPYLLYTYARASSILRKAKKTKQKLSINEINEKEFALVKKISEYPSVVEQARKSISPNLVAMYSFDLSKLFNEFYHENVVIGSKEEVFRLELIETFRTVLKKALELLGIETLEEM